MKGNQNFETVVNKRYVFGISAGVRRRYSIQFLRYARACATVSPRLSSKYFSLPFVTVDKEEYEKKKLFMHVETWEKMYTNLHYLSGFPNTRSVIINTFLSDRCHSPFRSSKFPPIRPIDRLSFLQFKVTAPSDSNSNPRELVQ